MRITGAVLLVIAIFAIGFMGLSMQTQQVEDTAMNNSTNMTQDTYNATTGFYETFGNTFGTAIPWLGITAIMLVVIGFLVTVAPRGR